MAVRPSEVCTLAHTGPKPVTSVATDINGWRVSAAQGTNASS